MPCVTRRLVGTGRKYGQRSFHARSVKNFRQVHGMVGKTNHLFRQI